MAARTFNGTSDKLRKASAAVTGLPCTFCAWIKAANLIGDMTIFQTGKVATAESMLRIATDANDKAFAQEVDSTGAAAQATSSGNVVITTWTHIAGRFTSASSRDIYINGTKTSNTTGLAGLNAFTQTNVGVLGFNGSEIQWFEGDLAEVMVFDYALTDGNISDLAAGTTPAITDPIAYWPVIGAASPEPDEMGGTGLTVTGAVDSTFTPGTQPYYAFPTGGPATEYALSGPSSGVVNVASSAFTLTPDGDADGIAVVIASDGSGTFAPSDTITFSGAGAATFTYTPTSTTGSPHTLSFTDDGGLTDPANHDYTVNAASAVAVILNQYRQRRVG